MDYWNKYAVVTLSYLQAYLKCEDLQGNKAVFFFFPLLFSWRGGLCTEAHKLFSCSLN